jgi:hypothetical protein
MVYGAAHGTRIALNAGHEDGTILEKPDFGNSKSRLRQTRTGLNVS